MIAGGEIGDVHFIHGAYLQDWLLEADRFLVAARAGEGRRELRGRRHRLALVRSGAARHRPADRRGARRSDDGDRHAAEAVGVDARRLRRAATSARERSASAAKISRRSCVRFDGGAKGSVSVGQVCAGHKNGLWFEVNGRQASVRWQQERQNELWIGRRDAANAVLAKDPSLLAPGARGYAHLPGGHQEALGRRVLQRHARRLRLHRRGDAPGRPRDRLRSRPSKTAIIRRASSTPCSRATAPGGVWTKVPRARPCS